MGRWRREGVDYGDNWAGWELFGGVVGWEGVQGVRDGAEGERAEFVADTAFVGSCGVGGW